LVLGLSWFFSESVCAMRPCPQVQRCGNPLERHRSFRSQPPRDPDFSRIAFGPPATFSALV